VKRPPDRPLDVVQQWFQAVVTHPDGLWEGEDCEEARRLFPDGIASVVQRSTSLTAAERLSIYANAYYSRLYEVLGDGFPLVRRVLGDDVFQDFACEYLQRYPSRSYTLDKLGVSFPRFLAECRPEAETETGDAAPDWPDFLSDLARLELEIARVFDGPGVEGQTLLQPEVLQSLGPERFATARLVPVPCLRLLRFGFPVNDFFTAARHTPEEEELAIPAAAPELVALTRTDFVVRRFTLRPTQHALLAALCSGAPVAEAIAAAAAVSDEPDDAFASEIQESFLTWTRAGFFQAIQLAG
jgi:hypothetical protein